MQRNKPFHRLRARLGARYDDWIIRNRLFTARLDATEYDDALRHVPLWRTRIGRFYVDPTDTCITRALARHGDYEPVVRGALTEIARDAGPNAVHIDVGAHWGWHTRTLAHHGATVVAFEPDADNRRLLARNTAGKAVHVRPEAVGSHDHRAHWVPGEGNTGMGRLSDDHVRVSQDGTAWRPNTVPVVALDGVELPKGRVACIKVDSQGGEAKVVCGALSLIQADRPALVVECIPAVARDIDDLLAPDYSVHLLEHPGTVVEEGREYHYLYVSG